MPLGNRFPKARHAKEGRRGGREDQGARVRRDHDAALAAGQPPTGAGLDVRGPLRRRRGQRRALPRVPGRRYGLRLHRPRQPHRRLRAALARVLRRRRLPRRPLGRPPRVLLLRGGRVGALQRLRLRPQVLRDLARGPRRARLGRHPRGRRRLLRLRRDARRLRGDGPRVRGGSRRLPRARHHHHPRPQLPRQALEPRACPGRDGAPHAPRRRRAWPTTRTRPPRWG